MRYSMYWRLVIMLSMIGFFLHQAKVLYMTPAGETAMNLQLMRLIDEQYLETPFYGYPRMTAHLRRAGFAVNPKRVARLMQKMGLQGLFPRRKTTIPAPGHTSYPYLLHGLAITHPD